MMGARCLAAACAVALLGAGCSISDRATPEVTRHIRRTLETSRGRKADTTADVRRFYDRREYRPAWFRGTRPRAEWDRLAEAVDRAPEHGLDPSAYGLEELRKEKDGARRGLLRRPRFDPDRAARLDVRLTHAFLLYASHLLNGVLEPGGTPARRGKKRGERDPVEVLEEALSSGRVDRVLAGLAPSDPRYRRLSAALQEAARDGDDGRRRRLAVNLDRWRRLPRDLGPRYILVNIPAFDLRLVEGGRETLQMRVVVGTSEDPTPVFSDAITHIVFSPTWNVPDGILEDEILPALAEDETTLERMGLHLIDKEGKRVEPDDVDLDDPTSFRILQPPGPANALGRIKFVLPNRYNVYLHDTPYERSFERDHRTFSHGCVRLEKPVELAERLLADQPRWTREAIEKAMVSGEKVVRLTEPLPVHIVYWTDWVDGEGAVQIADDVYARDRGEVPIFARAAARVPSRRSRP